MPAEMEGRGKCVLWRCEKRTGLSLEEMLVQQASEGEGDPQGQPV